MARNSYFNENTLEELLEEIKYVYQSDKRPWVIGYSGGKDSTTVVELVYKMLQMLPKEERNKNVSCLMEKRLVIFSPPVHTTHMLGMLYSQCVEWMCLRLSVNLHVDM